MSQLWSLTHWGRDKMDAISQTTFSSAFSWMKMFEFRINIIQNWYFSMVIHGSIAQGLSYNVCFSCFHELVVLEMHVFTRSLSSYSYIRTWIGYKLWYCMLIATAQLMGTLQAVNKSRSNITLHAIRQCQNRTLIWRETNKNTMGVFCQFFAKMTVKYRECIVIVLY